MNKYVVVQKNIIIIYSSLAYTVLDCEFILNSTEDNILNRLIELLTDR